jgi:drug/metabolite transporter (DMT)-like permease
MTGAQVGPAGCQRRAYGYALAAVCFWSTVASAFKIALRYQDPLHLLFFASWVSLLVLFVIAVVQRKLGLLRRYAAKDYLRSAMLGVANPVAYYIILFKAYSLLPAQEAQPLNFTWAVVLAVLSIVFLKQRIGLRSILGIVVSFLGAAIIATRGDFLSLRFSNRLGVSLAVGSSVIWASFWICHMQDKRDEVMKLFLSFLFGSIYILLVVVCFAGPRIPSAEGLVAAAYVGVFEMGVTFVLWLKALRLSTTTARVGNLIYLAPFLSFVLIRLVVGETIRVTSVIGLVLIVSGIAIQGYAARSSGP